MSLAFATVKLNMARTKSKKKGAKPQWASSSQRVPRQAAVTAASDDDVHDADDVAVSGWRDDDDDEGDVDAKSVEGGEKEEEEMGKGI